MRLTVEQRNDIVTENMPLVFKVCAPYRNRADHEDMIQDATMAFLEALDSYDDEKTDKDGNKIGWTTYVYRPIVWAVCKRLWDKGIHLPPHIQGAIRACQERAVASEITDEVIESVSQDNPSKQVIPVDHIRAALRSLQCRQEVTADEDNRRDVPDYDHNWTMDVENHEVVNRLLALLTDQQRKVVTARYLTDAQQTLDEVGCLLGVSKERVRQIEAAALATMNKWDGAVMAA